MITKCLHAGEAGEGLSIGEIEHHHKGLPGQAHWARLPRDLLPLDTVVLKIITRSIHHDAALNDAASIALMKSPDTPCLTLKLKQITARPSVSWILPTLCKGYCKPMPEPYYLRSFMAWSPCLPTVGGEEPPE